MDEDEINYKQLRHLQQAEQASPVLSKINQQFYNKLAEYLHRLDMVAEQEQNPQKQKLVLEEIQNIKKIVNNICEQREKKIVHAALSASRGGKPEFKHLVESEKKLYEELVALISHSRNTVFFVTPKGSTEKKKTEDTPEKKTPENPLQQEQNQNPIVRVTTDIPAFVGTDMKTYMLQKEDVLSLAREMADPLLKRGVIQHIT